MSTRVVSILKLIIHDQDIYIYLYFHEEGRTVKVGSILESGVVPVETLEPLVQVGIIVSD